MKDCKPCQISGAIAVSTDICRSHDLSCDEIYQAIEENKEPEEFIGIIENLRDKSEGQAKEQFSIVLDELDKRLEEINQNKEG